MLTDEIKYDFERVLKDYVSEFRYFTFETYENNKADFYKDFGNQLIVSKKVNLVPTASFKSQRMNQFVSSTFQSDIRSLVEENGSEGFFSNRIVKKLQIKNRESKEYINIPIGMKLSKAFSFFINDKYSLHLMQTRYSQYINTAKLSGDLCLSIHPMDYLSISQNDNGWSSCQRLDSDYAAGTLSLMNDKTTLVGYLHNGKMSENIFETPDVEWNSKQWRVLVHIDKTRNLVVFSKNYPFSSPELENELLEMIREIYPDSELGMIQEASEVLMDDSIGNTMGRVNYNDIRPRSVSGFIPNVSLGRLQHSKVLIGYPVPCLCCGEREITQPAEFCCDQCSSNNYTCECCGDSGFHEEDMYYVESEGIMVCENCKDNEYVWCSNCSCLEHHSDSYYSEWYEEYYCNHCSDDVMSREEEERAEAEADAQAQEQEYREYKKSLL